VLHSYPCLQSLTSATEAPSNAGGITSLKLFFDFTHASAPLKIFEGRSIFYSRKYIFKGLKEHKENIRANTKEKKREIKNNP